MNNWSITFETMISIAILVFAAWIFKVDLQLLLLLSIAYDITYMRIDKYNEQHRKNTPRD